MAERAPRFELVRRLGAGGMGEVWLARMDGPKGGLVALKRMRLDRDASAELRARFDREGRVCAALAHPKIVALKTWGVDELGPFLVFEYVAGPSAAGLLKALASRQLDLPLAAGLSVARDVAEALAWAHAGGRARAAVIHRDVSPDNVLLGPDGIAKLADFGVSKMVGGTTTLTRTGAVQGKFSYLAPELFDGHEADVRTDVFAFGVTLFELLCGVRPFFGKTEAEIVRAILAGGAPPPRALRPEIPAPLSDLMLRCLAQRREERPSAMREVLAALGSTRAPWEGHAAVQAALHAAFPDGLEAGPAPAAEPKTDRTLPAAVRTPPRRRLRRSLVAVGLIGGAVGVGATLLHLARPMETAGQALLPEALPKFQAPVPAAPSPAGLALAAPAHPSRPEAPAEPPPVAPHTPAAHPVPARPRAPTLARGKLRVQAKPWGHVFVDGTLVGTTPFEPVALERGPHHVLIVNPELKAHVQQEVVIRPGEESAVKVVLQPR